MMQTTRFVLFQMGKFSYVLLFSEISHCKPFSGASPSKATSFTKELASRISKSSPLRFHAKINTNGLLVVHLKIMRSSGEKLSLLWI